MNSYLIRIQKIIEKKKMNQTSFSRSLGVSQGTFKNLFMRDTVPKVEMCYNICRVHNVSLDWLVTGQGEMFLTTPGERSPPQKQKSDSDEKDRRIAELEAQLVNTQTSTPSTLPTVSQACADSASALIRIMSENKAKRSLQLVNQVFIGDDEDEENYTREERKTG